MKNIDRRSFIRATLAGAGALVIPWPTAPVRAAQPKKFSTSDRVVLNKTGIATSRLAIGSGTHGFNKGSNQTKLGLDTFVGLIRESFDRGMTFWDMADQYGSHTYFREALKYVPRDKVVILTKVWTRDAAGVKADIERFRQEIGTDVIDILLLHCLTDDNWTTDMRATMDVVSEAREKGLLRTYGCSCHSLGALKKAADSEWVEVLLSRINHRGVAMDADPATVVPVLRQAHDSGKAVIGMKIAGAGDLRSQISQSLQFSLSQGFVDAFTMGFESVAELDDLMGKVAAVEV
ncbi:MAG TPA: aldo/keto reductase [Candidatus Glassbacteria bacterium]|nr:aldo/keto reductase [Candidatus Glassbacteria bacterium]